MYPIHLNQTIKAHPHQAHWRTWRAGYGRTAKWDDPRAQHGCGQGLTLASVNLTTPDADKHSVLLLDSRKIN